MKRYHVKDGVWGYEADDGLWVDYDDAMAEINATQTALSLMNKTAEVMHKEITALKAELEICKEFSGARDVALRANEEEISILKAEIAALKAPPKVLSAEEVTEVGWYWARFGSSWDQIIEFYPPGGFEFPSHGQFIGPINPPEVSKTELPTLRAQAIEAGNAPNLGWHEDDL